MFCFGSTNKKENSSGYIASVKGFTLAELLVVVAILAILVAVSIPIFTARLDAASQTTCEANRRSARAYYVVNYLEKGDDTYTLESVINNIRTIEAISDCICPKGGSFYVQDGQIMCTVHDGDPADAQRPAVLLPYRDKIVDFSSMSVTDGKRSFTPGAIIFDEGKYYYILSTITGNNGVNMAAVKNSTGAYGATVMKIETPYNESTLLASGVRIDRGDIYVENNRTYVCIYPSSTPKKPGEDTSTKLWKEL